MGFDPFGPRRQRRVRSGKDSGPPQMLDQLLRRCGLSHLAWAHDHLKQGRLARKRGRQFLHQGAAKDHAPILEPSEAAVNYYSMTAYYYSMDE